MKKIMGIEKENNYVNLYRDKDGVTIHVIDKKNKDHFSIVRFNNEDRRKILNFLAINSNGE